MCEAIARLASGVDEPAVPPGAEHDEVDRALASLPAIEDKLAAAESAASRARARLQELSEVMLALVNLDFSRQATVTGADDVFDGYAVYLNILGEELSRTTVSKAYVSNIVESMNDPLVVTDPRGAVESVNRATCALTGYAREELVGRPLSSLFPGMITSELIERGATSEPECTCLTRAGEPIAVSLSTALMRDRRGALQGLVCVARDLTESKRLEEERFRLLDEVRRQAFAIEELSTPLLPITGDILVLPLIGSLDQARIQRVTEALLSHITAAGARVAILDITGVRTFDTQAVHGLIRTVQAVKLIGAEVVLTGIRPDAASTLVQLDLTLDGVVTFGSLQRGIQHAMRRPSAPLATRKRSG